MTNMAKESCTSVAGLTDYSDETYMNASSDVDNMPYTTLSYANGPGYLNHIIHTNKTDVTRRNLTHTDTSICPVFSCDIIFYLKIVVLVSL